MKKYTMQTSVGVFVFAGLIFIAYMALNIGEVVFLKEGYQTVRATFSSVSGLREGSSVEMFGLEVGKVADMRIDQKTQMVVVDLKIEQGLKVYDDAIASIKTSGLIGDKYVRIDPGGGGELLGPGGMITDTSSPIDIEEIVGKYAFGEVGGKKEKQKNE